MHLTAIFCDILDDFARLALDIACMEQKGLVIYKVLNL